MKTTTIILAAALALQVNVLLAGNSASSPVTTESSVITMNALAPTTPMEATFDEIMPPLYYPGLTPLVPAEADFEEATAGIALNDLELVVVPVVNSLPAQPVGDAPFAFRLHDGPVSNGNQTCESVLLALARAGKA